MIKIVNLHKSFGTNKVLRGVDLEIQDGETLTIIGGSGSGKSVLIKHMIGLMQPNYGKVCVDGQDLTRLSEDELFEVQKKFGYLFQSAALFDSLTVEENVNFGLCHLSPMTLLKHPHMAEDKLALVGLQPRVKHLKPSELSGGMKKRVGLARAIAHEPKYILYDEPTTGLDPIMSDVINDLILELQKKLGVTSIIVTHDMKAAYKVSNRIAMLYEGHIVMVGTPQEIQRSQDPLVHQFITGSAQGPIQMKVHEHG